MSAEQRVNRQQFIFNFFLSLERGGTANCDSCRQERPVVAEVRAGGAFANDTDIRHTDTDHDSSDTTAGYDISSMHVFRGEEARAIGRETQQAQN